MNARRRRTGLILGCSAAFFVFALLVAVVMPLLDVHHHRYNPATCVSKLKQLTIAQLMYAADSDRLPARDVWMEAVSPYLKGDELFVCPELRRKAEPDKQAVYGYAMNSDLAGKNPGAYKEPGKEILLYDSINLARNASDPLLSLVWPGRHEGSNVVAFLEGHVKRFKSKADLNTHLR